MSRFLFGHSVQTHNNSLANLVRGVGERVLFVNRKCESPISPKSGIFRCRLASYRDQLSRYIGWQSPVTHDQFVSFYSGPRRLVYQRAVDGLAVMPVRPRDAHLKTFVKAEKLNFTLKPDPAPRVIQPRDPRYNVEIGCYLRPLEHKVYDGIDHLFKHPTIMSPYNAFQQASIIKGAWGQFVDPVCVGLDASRFDQHVSTQALEFEHGFYNSIFKDKKLAWLLKMQLVNRGYARANDGYFRYVKYGSRMSGDMNTSLGNKFLMCLMGKAYLDSKNFTMRFLNNGDDCLLFLERKHLKHIEDISAFFKSFGFNIKLEEPVTNLEEVEFCQTKPVCCNGTWRMVRNVRSALTKDVTTVNLGHDVAAYRRRLFDIGVCGLATASDVPVLGSFYRMLKRFGIEGRYQGFDDEYNWYRQSSRNAVSKFHAPDPYGRYSFWLSTGISPDAQVEIESYFDSSVWGGDKRQIIDQHFAEL